jgi:hypothetical protein
VRDALLWGGMEGERALLEDPQASPAGPSNNSRMQVKTMVRNSGLRQVLRNFDFLN